MGVEADGSYGLGSGFFYSVPVTCSGGGSAWSNCSPWHVPELGPCGSSGCAWRLWAVQPSESECQAPGHPATAPGAGISLLQLADSSDSGNSGGPVLRVGGIPITTELASAMEAQRVALSK
eukprot:scaffold53428_cov30-Phaeocystis_antarctica.AAC.1